MRRERTVFHVSNTDIARRLDEVGRLLADQGANPHRIRAYHRAAATLRHMAEPAEQILSQQGIEGLSGLPTIGGTLARSIRDLIVSGRLPLLERLRGKSDPMSLLASVPGIGEVLAERLHHDLGIGTLEELEVAAHDGRLENIAGFGSKRLSGVIEYLAGRLGRIRARAAPVEEDAPVEEILDIDQEYRDQAARGSLKRIAPRRFNPTGEAWLPVLHTHRGERHYTALFSNTARAHRLRRTHDWVVLYYDGDHGERQCTVVTEYRGELKGCRTVRGREADCLEYYRRQDDVLPRTPNRPQSASAGTSSGG
ncbi:MAG: DNA-binding protein [Gemmatimonadales bacterium]|nr:DNA-binding protein [Gemmatimonadales bacterium]